MNTRHGITHICLHTNRYIYIYNIHLYIYIYIYTYIHVSHHLQAPEPILLVDFPAELTFRLDFFSSLVVPELTSEPLVGSPMGPLVG